MVDPSGARVARLTTALAAQPAELPLLQALAAAHTQFLLTNLPEVASLVRLGRSSPALRRRWLTSLEVFEPEVIGWVCERTSCAPDLLYPRMIAGLALLVAQLAVERWDPDTSGEQLAQVIHEAYRTAATLAEAPRPPAHRPGCSTSASVHVV